MGEKGVTILVRSMSPYESGWCVEFHKVHVKKEEIAVEKNCYPKLLLWQRRGKMLRVGSKLYLLGVVAEGKDVECASVLDLNARDKEWKHLPLPIPQKNSFAQNYSVLDGKIYHYTNLPRYADGLTFFDFIWSPFGHNHILRQMVGDPANKRILLNLEPGYLCAYYPANCTVRMLGYPVLPWSDVIALVDNIAYVHYPESKRLISAFDISKGGKSVEVVWRSTVLNGFDFGEIDKFDALFHVPNRLIFNDFWLVACLPECPDGVHLCLVKFRAGLWPNNKGVPIVNCWPLDLRIHLLDPTFIVYDCALLPQ